MQYKAITIIQDEQGVAISQSEQFFEVPDVAVPPPPPPDPEPTPTILMEVVADQVNVRKSPTTSAEVVDVVKRGDRLDMSEATETADGWLWRLHPESKTYIAERTINSSVILLKKVGEATPPPSPVGTTVNTKGAMRLKTIDGIPQLDGFTKVGANLREGMWANTIDGLSDEDIKTVLDLYKENGIGHVRMYVHRVGVPFDQIIERLIFWANETAARGIQLIVVFDDSIQSGFHCDAVPDKYRFHTAKDTMGHLNIQWYLDGADTEKELGYRDPEYVMRLRTVAYVLREYTHVLLDVMNESAVVAPPAELGGYSARNYKAWRDAQAFLTETAYKASNGMIPILTGIINTRHAKPDEWTHAQTAADFYAHVPYATAASLHMYYEWWQKGNMLRFEDEAPVDIEAARDNDKAVLLGEWGVSSRVSGRAAKMTGFIDRFIRPNKISATYWGVDPRENSHDQRWTDDFAIASFRPEFVGMMTALKGLA